MQIIFVFAFVTFLFFHHAISLTSNNPGNIFTKDINDSCEEIEIPFERFYLKPEMLTQEFMETISPLERKLINAKTQTYELNAQKEIDQLLRKECEKAQDSKKRFKRKGMSIPRGFSTSRAVSNVRPGSKLGNNGGNFGTIRSTSVNPDNVLRNLQITQAVIGIGNGIYDFKNNYNEASLIEENRKLIASIIEKNKNDSIFDLTLKTLEAFIERDKIQKINEIEYFFREGFLKLCSNISDNGSDISLQLFSCDQNILKYKRRPKSSKKWIIFGGIFIPVLFGAILGYYIYCNQKRQSYSKSDAELLPMNP